MPDTIRAKTQAPAWFVNPYVDALKKFFKVNESVLRDDAGRHEVRFGIAALDQSVQPLAYP